MDTKTILIGDDQLSRRDIEYINDIVHEVLCDIGIEPVSFAWHIEVEYTEGGN